MRPRPPHASALVGVGVSLAPGVGREHQPELRSAPPVILRVLGLRGGREGGQRDWVQVVCNGGVPTVLAALFSLLLGGSQPHRMGTAAPLVCACVFAFVGYYACCCGDTWASEVRCCSASPAEC